MSKLVIFGGFRHTVESPRWHYPEAELWMQSTSIRSWDWTIFDWSRWFDIHTVGPQTFYPGIRIQRPDVLAWYMRQGNERPIYLTETHKDIIGSVAYPIDAVTERFGAEHFGCQLDYMAALAHLEGKERWILYGQGAPYVQLGWESPKTQEWFSRHGSFLFWLRKAIKDGVKITLDGPTMFTPEVIEDEEKWPTPAPLKARYGYDMQVTAEQYKKTWHEGHPFDRA